MYRKDYEETARALASGFARLDAALEPGGTFESMDPIQVRRLLAVVTGGVAEWFHDHNRVFNSEAFLRECGMFDDVQALNPHKPQRERFAPLDYVDVEAGDCLFYITSGAHQCAGIVSSITDLAVTLDHGWDLDQNVEMYGRTKLRRSNWSRHDVLLMDSSDLPRPPDAPHRDTPSNSAGVVAQAFPSPPRPGTPASGTTSTPASGQRPPEQTRGPSR